MIWLSVASAPVFAVGCSRSPTSSRGPSPPTRRARRSCALLWPIFALMQPLNGVVFALDGILIGASDGRYRALDGRRVPRVRRRARSRCGADGACAACGWRSWC